MKNKGLMIIAIILIIFIFPFGLNTSIVIPSGYYNDGICFDCNVPPDYFVINLLIILIPIISVIGIIILFYPSKKINSHQT